VGFGEAGHQARRFGELVERLVEAVFVIQKGSQNIMKDGSFRGLSVRIAQEGSNFVFGGDEILVVNQGGNFGRWAGAGAGGVGSGRLSLASF
jgi:hypothetical protein